MIIDCTAQEAFEVLGKYDLVYQGRFCPTDLQRNNTSPYRRGYEWLDHCESILKRQLKPWLDSYSLELFGTPHSSGVISEVLANAFCHGNQRNPQLAIEVSIFLGKEWLLLRFKDSGSGFDYKRAVNRMRAGKRYYTVAGNGLRRMQELKDISFFYVNDGSELYLLYRFNNMPILITQ